MEIIVTTERGKRSKVTVNDQNMTALLARLNGVNKWIDTKEDGKTFLNFDLIVKIEESPPIAGEQ